MPYIKGTLAIESVQDLGVNYPNLRRPFHVEIGFDQSNVVHILRLARYRGDLPEANTDVEIRDRDSILRALLESEGYESHGCGNLAVDCTGEWSSSSPEIIFVDDTYQYFIFRQSYAQDV